VDLVLTGHAHGGQWRLPAIGGVFAPGQGLLPKYTAGMYRLGKTVMCVSRGLGNTSFPLRIENKPELVLITLRNG
jgi:predicted MPP superfamily phosphohydrolase